MTTKATVDFYVEKVADSYTGYAKDFSILAEGDSISEVYANAREALAEQCEATGRNSADFNVVFRYDIPTFFEVYPVVNISALAQLLGMNNSFISQYISGKKTPGPKQRQRIETDIHNLGKQLVAFSFA